MTFQPEIRFPRKMEERRATKKQKLVGSNRIVSADGSNMSVADTTVDTMSTAGSLQQGVDDATCVRSGGEGSSSAPTKEEPLEMLARVFLFSLKKKMHEHYM